MTSQIDVFIINVECVPNINKIHIGKYVLRTYSRILFTLSIRIKKFSKTVITQKKKKKNLKDQKFVSKDGAGYFSLLYTPRILRTRFGNLFKSYCQTQFL